MTQWFFKTKALPETETDLFYFSTMITLILLLLVTSRPNFNNRKSLNRTWYILRSIL